MVLAKQQTHSYCNSAFSHAQKHGYLQVALQGHEGLIAEWTMWCADHNLPIITLFEFVEGAQLFVDLSFTGRVFTTNDQATIHTAWLSRRSSSAASYELTPMFCHFGNLSIAEAKILAESIQALLSMELQQLEHGLTY